MYSRFVASAKEKGERWEPLQVGFFKKSAKRFTEVADAYGELLKRVHWW